MLRSSFGKALVTPELQRQLHIGIVLLLSDATRHILGTKPALSIQHVALVPSVVMTL